MTTITHTAGHPGFNYYGRWHIDRAATSINSGSLAEFVYSGDTCVLHFDVEGFTDYPAICVQVDGGPITKTTLSCDVRSVSVTSPYSTLPHGTPPFAVASSAFHVARFWVAAHSLYRMDAAGKQWNTLVGGCQFRGANLGGGDLVPIPYVSRQIEFLGDSITQGLRLLYTGADADTHDQVPYANWPQYVADMLGMKPVVTGFGGQGLTTSGTCGVPPANAAFPYVYAGTLWTPSVQPGVVVIYHGTNDGVSPQEFEGCYAVYLRTVRMAYPSATIVAACPHNKQPYAAPISDAVGAMHDRKILFLDYSAGVISQQETCDGCHLNPGGAVRLAAKFAGDIQCHLSSLGV